MRIEIPHDKIHDFCLKWSVRAFSIFGSSIRDDGHSESDVDILVSFHDGTSWGLFEFFDMIDELQEIFGRKVDLVEKEALRNPIRKSEILSQRQVVYAA